VENVWEVTIMTYQHLFPIFVYPTLHCNFNCSYCFNLSGPLKAARSFLLDYWDKLLDDCARLRVPEVRVSGGEPLLISDLQRRCQAILDRGIRYTLLTNGSLLGRHLEWLSIAPPETLWISYHREFSSARIFERQVERAAKVLPSVGVHVFSCDVEMDQQLVERAVRAGARRIKILSLTSIGRCTKPSKTGTWEYNALEAMMLRWQNLSTELLEVRVEAPVFLGFSTGESTCVLRERPLMSIDHDGSVYPCCVTLGSGSTMLGSLQHDTMETIITRANSTSGQLPCGKLLPLISSNQACCPLRLVSLRNQAQHITTVS
jgi:MoaA/NifB/PqqE/SkfB family radical SAM enzyme